MTGDVMTGHELGKRWLVLRPGVILGVGAAETLAAEYLQWLLEAGETMLAADQRMVRGQLQQRLGTARV